METICRKAGYLTFKNKSSNSSVWRLATNLSGFKSPKEVLNGHSGILHFMDKNAKNVE
jgi:hypothetical protein